MKKYIKYIIGFLVAAVSFAATGLVYPTVFMAFMQQAILNVGAVLLFFIFKTREVLLNGKFILSKFLKENTPRLVLGIIAVLLIQFFIAYDLVMGTSTIAPLLASLGINAEQSTILLSITVMGLFYDLKGKESNEN